MREADALAFDLPRRDYAVILADPPWRFRTWSESNQRRSARRHYPLMTLDEIKALPVGEVAAPVSALFLWSLNSMLPEALEVIDAWGFTFRTVAFTWVKLTPRAPRLFMDARAFSIGMGYWSRQNTEQVLLATRGRPRRVSRSVQQLLIAPRREHSRKPDEIYPRIEALLGGPYLELFARRRHAGWDAWGNETERFGRVA